MYYVSYEIEIEIFSSSLYAALGQDGPRVFKEGKERI